MRHRLLCLLVLATCVASSSGCGLARRVACAPCRIMSSGGIFSRFGGRECCEESLPCDGCDSGVEYMGDGYSDFDMMPEGDWQPIGPGPGPSMESSAALEMVQ